MPRVSTIPSAKDSRNLAGRVRRLLSSIVCSYSPSSIRRAFSSPLHSTLNHIVPQRNPLAPRKGHLAPRRSGAEGPGEGRDADPAKGRREDRADAARRDQQPDFAGLCRLRRLDPDVARPELGAEVEEGDRLERRETIGQPKVVSVVLMRIRPISQSKISPFRDVTSRAP